MENFDHYAAAKLLSAKLSGEGYSEWSQKIDDSMVEGATGTEIFMILRMRTSEFLLSEQGSPAVIALAGELLRQLNDSLS
ncbi:hypothetical protein Q4S45_22710 [Massilia sp. R2A-15]|uniref:hypothetical protein n=1 Tax=Massilia sp. R2A-15 TaxID=3064278 RepID=UPI0027377304|nr:hypothetical protein [Massilia sp. R2A-15]WLI89470.1 hypothetical protein Q4S45_22710 [Massilia sp. R2A-15]